MFIQSHKGAHRRFMIVNARDTASRIVEGGEAAIPHPVEDSRDSRWVVGWGMAPRGEVGLIFAVVGKQLGVVDDEEFAAVVIMVMLTTLLTPPILARLLRNKPVDHPDPSHSA